MTQSEPNVKERVNLPGEIKIMGNIVNAKK